MPQEHKTSMYHELFQFPPGREGYYGPFGGAFIPEILHETIDELQAAFAAAHADPTFWDEYVSLMASYSCRPTPLTRLDNLSQQLGGPALRQTRRPQPHRGPQGQQCDGSGTANQTHGKSRVIAETGAGQHGVATATMAARMGFQCAVYMGALDVERQRPNVFGWNSSAPRWSSSKTAHRRSRTRSMRRCATGRSPWTRRTTSWGPSVVRILSPRWLPIFSPLSVAKHVRRCCRP